MSSELPDWFVEARAAVSGCYRAAWHDGCEIVYQTWGRAGLPPMLLLHGAGASSEWWEATALLLADRFHIVAPSSAGCGRSQWRDRYRIEQTVEEAMACAVEAFGAGADANSVCVAHSFGSEAGVRLAIDPAQPVSQLILVDSLMGLYGSPDSSFPLRERQFYPSQEDAVRRFSTVPRDNFGPKALRDHIACQSLEAVEEPGRELRWSWRADPNLMARLDCQPIFGRIGEALCPIDFIYGARSSMNSAQVRKRQEKAVTCDAQFLEIADSGHHIPLDRPQELAEVIMKLVDSRFERALSP